MCLVTAGVGTAILEQSTFENRTNDAVTTVLEDEEYERPDVVSVRAHFAHFGVGEDQREISVVVARPADRPYPAFSRRLERRTQRATGTDVCDTVEYVETSTASSLDRSGIREANPRVRFDFEAPRAGPTVRREG